jgi:hypothetical protein
LALVAALLFGLGYASTQIRWAGRPLSEGLLEGAAWLADRGRSAWAATAPARHRAWKWTRDRVIDSWAGWTAPGSDPSAPEASAPKTSARSPTASEGAPTPATLRQARTLRQAERKLERKTQESPKLDLPPGAGERAALDARLQNVE